MPANPLKAITAFFDFQGHHTSFQREAVAGLTTFVTMSYIIAVNPAILKEAESRRDHRWWPQSWPPSSAP